MLPCVGRVVYLGRVGSLYILKSSPSGRKSIGASEEVKKLAEVICEGLGEGGFGPLGGDLGCVFRRIRVDRDLLHLR